MLVAPARNQEIEALRGVAILLVLYGHMGSLLVGETLYGLSREFLQPGTGVDLFFCISGYVITRHLIREPRTERSWSAFAQFAGPFWIRRFFRLAPSAWLWLAVLLVFSYVVDDTLNFTRNLYHTVAAFFQLANFHLYECRSAATQVVCGRPGYYWSLALEEQFYILFPFMLVFLTRRMLLVAVVAIILLQVFSERNALMWLIRTDALAFGVLIALLQQSPGYAGLAPRWLSRPWLQWLPFAVCVAVIACIEAPAFFNGFTGRYATGIVAVTSAVLIWLSSFESGFAVPAGRFSRVLIYFGTRSYALYLIHVPTSWIVPRLLQSAIGHPADPVTSCIAVYAATMAATELNYRYLETPLRRYGAKVADRFRNLRYVEPAPAATRDAAPAVARPPAATAAVEAG